jgi:hypothetical protein
MDANSIKDTTFRLAPVGTINYVPATVRYVPTTNTAILDPNADLQLGTTYRAIVSTAAKDVAGNPLDQNANMLGLQGHQWSFRIGN